MKIRGRFISALCAAALLLALSVPALAEEAGFSDVPAGSWFHQGVATCAERGVMVGVGEDAFSPAGTLTNAECLTLALRLYDLRRGGNGTLETAPEDRGRLTLTLADGTVFSGYGYRGDGAFGWWSWRNGYEGVTVEVPGWSYDDMGAGRAAQREWMDAHPTVCGANDPATLTLDGVTYQGTTHCWMPAGPYVFQFQPEADKTDEVNAVLRDAVYYACPPSWYQDAYYTAEAWGLGDREAHPGFAALLEADAEYSATRQRFAAALADAAGELEKRRDVAGLPDLERSGRYNESIFRLYEAGILNGVDGDGTFAGDSALTRAEAAVMVARVLDERQRLGQTADPGTPQAPAEASAEQDPAGVAFEAVSTWRSIPLGMGGDVTRATVYVTCQSGAMDTRLVDADGTVVKPSQTLIADSETPGFACSLVREEGYTGDYFLRVRGHNGYRAEGRCGWRDDAAASDPAGLDGDGVERLFDSLDVSEVAYVDLICGGYPPYRLPDGEVEQLVAYLKQIEIGDPEPNYMDYDGMVSQMFVLHLENGEALHVSASNPFLIVNEAGYHCDYETCHEIALIYRAHLAELRANGTPETPAAGTPGKTQ